MEQALTFYHNFLSLNVPQAFYHRAVQLAAHNGLIWALSPPLLIKSLAPQAAQARVSRLPSSSSGCCFLPLPQRAGQGSAATQGIEGKSCITLELGGKEGNSFLRYGLPE